MAGSQPGRPPYTGPTHTFDHGQLGPLTGRLIQSPPHFPGTSTVQFCSIPYALVPKRFAPCTPLTEIPEGFDSRPYRVFTQFGTACPQVGAAKPVWFDGYGGHLEDDKGIVFDEFTCLTVSISVPQSQLSASSDGASSSGPGRKGLPVMIYIHGGGAQEGVGHVDGLHSNAPLTAYASSLSLPVVTVNIGYRLNWFGSLVCQDMVDEYSTALSADPANPAASPSPHGPFNLTLQDQRAAFMWIHEYIGGFGGDADNVTAFGESAGSFFLIYHIGGSPERLFNRVILQSGPILGHSPFEEKEKEYQALLKHFNIAGASASERLDLLRQVPPDLLAQYPGRHVFPFVDDIPGVAIKKPLFPRGTPTVTAQMTLIPTCPWLEDVMIGDDFWEGQVLTDLIRNASPQRLVGAVKTLLPNGQASEKMLEEYDLPNSVSTASEMDRNLFWHNLAYFIGDLLFSMPIHQLTNHLASPKRRRKVYRYTFCLSNPFLGSALSFVPGHHFVDILFVFLTLLDRYPRRRDRWLERQARETAKRWIVFANGQEPWEEYGAVVTGSDNKIAVCDDLRGWHVRTTREDETESQSDPWGPRRYSAWRAMEAAFDTLQKPGMSEESLGQSVNMARLMIIGATLTKGGGGDSREEEGGDAGDAGEKKEAEVAI